MRARSHTTLEWNGCAIIKRHYGEDGWYRKQICDPKTLSTRDAKIELSLIIEGVLNVDRLIRSPTTRRKTGAQVVKTYISRAQKTCA